LTISSGLLGLLGIVNYAIGLGAAGSGLECTPMIGQKGLGESDGVIHCSPE